MTGHIRRRGKSSWELKWELPRDPKTGRRNTRTKTLRSTKKDAERELRRILCSIETGTYVDPSKLILGEFLVRWLEDWARSRVSPRTYERYEEIIFERLIPALGYSQLTALQPISIQEAYTDWLRRGRKDGRGGLSAQTVLHFHKVLSRALDQAVRWRMLQQNPAKFATPPRPQKTPVVTLTENELVKLISGAEGSRLFLPIVLASTLGLRRGEILALRWRDLDWDKAELRIERALELTKKYGLRLKSPKTDRGRRTIALPQFTLRALHHHRVAQAEYRLLMGRRYENNDLVCSSTVGTFWHPRNLSRAFRAMVDKLGLPPVNFHGLRHTHITHLLRAGVHPKIASERAGHASVAITMDIYSHVLPNMQRDAAAKVDEYLDHARIGKERGWQSGGNSAE